MSNDQYGSITQDFRHGWWKQSGSGHYVPSSEDILRSKKAAWRQNMLKNPDLVNDGYAFDSPSQDLQHGFWKNTMGGDYVPSSKDIQSVRKEIWRRSATATPAKRAARDVIQNQAMIDYLLKDEDEKQKKQSKKA
jgi:hypothetical protein